MKKGAKRGLALPLEAVSSPVPGSFIMGEKRVVSSCHLPLKLVRDLLGDRSSWYPQWRSIWAYTQCCPTTRPMLC